MSKIVLNLPSSTEQKLREKASQSGQTLEDYLQHLAEHEAEEKNGAPAISEPAISGDEFDQLLDELAAGPTLPHLPADFSRADVYADHD